MDTTASEQQRLLIVDDSKVVRVTARKILRDHFETIEAVDGENAWDILTSDKVFSLVISDLSMPELDGFGLLERIRNSPLPHIRDLPVIIITGANDSEATKERAGLAGATDFIGKPFDSVHLLARTQAHASAHATAHTLREESLALENDSAVDPLTRLANEMTFMELGYQQLAYAIRHKTNLSIFHIEVDHFGDLYKELGENVSESIIQTVATILTATVRHEDTAARIGAARFAVLLPGLNNNSIKNLANRIMKNVSEHVLKHGDKRTRFSISIGIAATEIRRDTRFDDLLEIAKRRLLYAIDRGGNRVAYEAEDNMEVSRKHETELAVAERAVFMGETDTQAIANFIEIEETTEDLPTIECSLAATPAASPDKRTATGSIHLNCNQPGSAHDTATPLHIPDLSLVADIPALKADISRHTESGEDETIEITADNKPFTTQHPDTASFETSPESMDTTTRHLSKKNTGKTNNNGASLHTPAIRKARIGFLERLLTKMYSLFKMARKSA